LNFACFEAAILILAPVRGCARRSPAREATEKVPKPDEPYLVAALQSVRDRIEHRIDSLAGLRFAQLGLVSHSSTSSFLFTRCPYAIVRDVDDCSNRGGV